MTLKEYLEKKNIGVSRFAQIAGLKQAYVSLLKDQKRRPSPQVALEIEKATKGKVTTKELLYPDAK